MTRRLLLSLSPGEIWAALVEDGDLSALRLVRTHGAARAGDIFLGRVVALRPDVPAVLVDIGEDRPGFLGGEDMAHDAKLHEGEAVVVRVTKAARADKAASLTMKLDVQHQGIAANGPPPRLLHRLETPLAALLKEFTPDEVMIDDVAALAEAKKSGCAVHLHAAAEPLFEAEGIAADVEAALAPRVALPKDGSITIETTAAATLIDVDGGRGGALSTNLAAGREIAKQIRLRDLSGPIVIDFIGMKDRGARDRVASTLKTALGEEPNYLGWTRLGHFELTVKRRRPSLTEQLFEYRPGGATVKAPITVALEALRQLRWESRAMPSKRFNVHVHPDVAACLAGAADGARRELEGQLGHPIKIVAERRPRDSLAIVPVSSGDA